MIPSRYFALALGVWCALSASTARADEDATVTDEAEDGDEGDDIYEDEDEDEDEAEEEVIVNDKGEPVAKKEPDFKKQDLRGHDVGDGAATNLFEKDRFFVDKVDTKQTRKGTLVQGSLTSSSFLYRESSGVFTTAGGTDAGVGAAASKFGRLFTDLRLQTDFRHIAGGRWDARVDLRARVVTTPDSSPLTDPTRIQSGLDRKSVV